MKKNKIILLFGIIALFITSCKKFLSVDPPYAQDAENYFRTPDDYDRALTGAYDMLQGRLLLIMPLREVKV